MRRPTLTTALLTTALVLMPQLTAAATETTPDRLSAGGVVVDVPAAVSPPPAVEATSWLVADLDSGDVIAAQGAHTPLAPASTLKTLTALTLLPRLDTTELYTATREDANIEGSKVGLVADSVYTVDDLFHGLMLGSGNDAANALAMVAGGRDVTLDLMTEQAELLGADDTVVGDPSGLDAPGQVSSAHDLAVIARAGLAVPEFAELVATRIYDFPAAGTSLGADRERFQIQNKNRLLWRYEGALGVKNGYTVAARGSLVGAAERDGRRLVATVMRTEGDPAAAAEQLLDWGFAAADQATPVGTLPEPGDQGAPDDTPAPATTAPAPEVDEVVAAPAASTPMVPVWLIATVAVLLLLGLRIAWVARRREIRRRQRARQAGGSTSPEAAVTGS